MNDVTKPMWLVRAGRGAEGLEAFTEQSVVGLCFDSGAKLPANPARPDIVDLVHAANPTAKKQAVMMWAAQQYRLLSTFSLAISSRHTTLTGATTSSARSHPGTLGSSDAAGYCHARRVKWLQKTARDELSLETRNTLGAIQTFFLVNESAAADLHGHARALDTPEVVVSHDELTSEETAVPDDAWLQSQINGSEQLIEDRIVRLDPMDMQELVAGILRAMGYKTKVSPSGPDRGVDIFASPDGIGLEEPRIFVEVKHRAGAMGAPQVRPFLGGRNSRDRCLYVSTGGFSKEARYEADRAQVSLTLLGLADLRKLLVDFYDKLDAPTAKLVPLRRIYLAPTTQGPEIIRFGQWPKRGVHE